MPFHPFPSHPFTITGGCACTSLRYKVTVPSPPNRPLHPRQSPSAPATHLPIVFTDHCNDCRRANGAIVPAWVCVPLEWVTVECVRLETASREGMEDDGRVSAPIDRGMADSPQQQQQLSLPGEAALMPVLEGGESAQRSDLEGTSLRYYASSPEVARTFCGRCGTHLSFASREYMKGIVDLVLGTIDREILELGWMMPTRQCWCNSVLPWMKVLVGLDGQKGERREEGSKDGWTEMGRHPEGEYNDYC